MNKRTFNFIETLRNITETSKLEYIQKHFISDVDTLQSLFLEAANTGADYYVVNYNSSPFVHIVDIRYVEYINNYFEQMGFDVSQYNTNIWIVQYLWGTKNDLTN